MASVTDGTSSTVIWGEMVRGRNGTATNGPNQLYRMSLPMPKTNTYVPLVTYLNACQDATTLAGWDYKGRIWGTDQPGEGGGYSHIMTSNRNACIFQDLPVAWPMEDTAVCVGAGSFHPGGVNVGFLDGSVRFIKDSIDPPTWWSIATRAGAEVIDAGSL